MPANQPSRNTVITLAGLAVIIAGFLVCGYWPYWRESRQLQAEIKQRQEAIADAAVQSARLRDLTRKVQVLELEVRPYDRLVPESKELGTFLGQLSGQLDAAGMKDIAVRAMAPTVLGKCEQLPIEVRSAGSFAKFHDFLHRLEGLPRMSAVSHLSVEADGGMSGQVAVEVMLSIYNTKANEDGGGKAR